MVTRTGCPFKNDHNLKSKLVLIDNYHHHFLCPVRTFFGSLFQAKRPGHPRGGQRRVTNVGHVPRHLSQLSSTDHVNVRRDRSGRANVYLSINGARLDECGETVDEGGAEHCCRERDGEKLVVAVVLSYPRAVVTHQSSLLLPGVFITTQHTQHTRRKQGWQPRKDETATGNSAMSDAAACSRETSRGGLTEVEARGRNSYESKGIAGMRGWTMPSAMEYHHQSVKARAVEDRLAQGGSPTARERRGQTGA